MFSNVILLGRTVDDVKLVTLESGQKVANVTLAIQRPFKNENDEYEVDFIPVQLWQWVAETVSEYCKKGSVIAIKARLSTRNIEIQGKKVKTIEVVGERVFFVDLKNKPNEEKITESKEDVTE